MILYPPNLGPGPDVAAPPTKRGLAVASLVLGIVALIVSVAPVINVVSILMGAVSIVLAARALAAARRRDAGGWNAPGWDLGGRYTGNRDADGKGMATAGLTLSIVAIIGSLFIDLVFAAGFDDTEGSCGPRATACAWTAPVETPIAQMHGA